MAIRKQVEAKLEWIRPEKGGRPAPPSGPKYSTVARFESQKEIWQKEGWSLIIEFTEQPDSSWSHRVRVSFLADNAPIELLAKGCLFELMEGAHAVARGTVL